MLPLMASSMSVSLGFGRRLSSAAAAMIWPAWQYPHCGTPRSTHAACSARPTGSLPTASIVTIFRFATAEIGVMHERTG